MTDVKYLDGNLFKKLVFCGASNLDKHRITVNNLNVFPVPDGDTGDNMMMTIGYGTKEISDLDTDNISLMSKKLSRGMLFGARGNSGVILSQIFRGIADGLKDVEHACAMDLANAFISGYEKAYKMVVNPVEGTILTVARNASDKTKSCIKDNTSVNEFFSIYLKYANETLKDTINMLDVLKKANVIDSGGAGLVYIIEGMLKYFDDSIDVDNVIFDKMNKTDSIAKCNTELKEYATISVCNGDGLKEIFNEMGTDYIIDGGQTMNPSTEDFIKAFDIVNAKNIVVLPNNSNIILAAMQAKDIYDKSNIIIIPSKTIAEGLSAISMMNYDDPDFIIEMEEAIKNVITGEVTYSVRDTSIDGFDIKKNDFMGIVGKKIVSVTNDKYDCLKELVNYVVNENNKEVVNIICGKDIEENLINNTIEEMNESIKNIDISSINGNQDVYSFIVSFE